MKTLGEEVLLVVFFFCKFYLISWNSFHNHDRANWIQMIICLGKIYFWIFLKYFPRILQSISPSWIFSKPGFWILGPPVLGQFHVKSTKKVNVKNLQFIMKLDGVGPIDNRPSTVQPNSPMCKKKNKKNSDMWHMTSDTWQLGEGEPSLKISAP